MTYPATQISSEQVFAALFALATPLAGSNANPSLTPYKIMSRRFKHWSQVPADQYPAFYQFQTPQTATGYDRGVGKLTMRASWYVYLPTSANDQDIVSTRMNNYKDALLNVLRPANNTGYWQTLGLRGVAKAFPDGQIFMDEGLLEPPALIRIPISILIGQ
jgi:hypothetical protein